MRLLILGAGAVTSEFYAPVLNSFGWAKSTTIADPSAAAIDLAKTRLPDASFLQCGWEQALGNHRGDFDAAIVALPNHLHGKASRCCLESGLHVLCEKPLTLVSAEANELDDLARSRNRLLAVGMVRRLVPAFKAMRHLLAEGAIGRVLSISIEDGDRYAWVTQSGEPFRSENGGVLADIGIHYLDLIYVLLGKIEPDRYSDDWSGGVEANCDLHMRAPNDVRVRLRLSRTRALQNAITITGEKGKLVQLKGVFDSGILRTTGGGEGCFHIDVPFVSGPWASTTFESCFAEQFFNFENAIKSGSYDQVVRGREAAKSIGILEWCYETRRKAQRPRIEVTPAEQPLDSVVVTGGTGFIGTHLVRRLASQGGRNVRILLRSFRSSAAIATHRVQMSPCDLLDAKAVKDSLTGAKFVYHLAYGRDGPNPERFTVQSTRNVVQAAIEQGVESVIILSTAWVFGLSRELSTIDESAPYNPFGGTYAESKAKMERWCLERAKTSATRIVVLNPTCVFGPYGGAYTILPFELATNNRFCWIDNGAGLANIVYVENLVDAMLLASRTKAVAGQRFIINDGTVTWRSFLGALIPESEYPSRTREELLAEERRERSETTITLLTALRNEQVRSLFAKTRAGRFLKRVMDAAGQRLVARLTRIQASIPTIPVDQKQSTHGSSPAWIADLYGPNRVTFSSNKANDLLGWVPRVKIDDALDVTRRWLRREILF